MSEPIDYKQLYESESQKRLDLEEKVQREHNAFLFLNEKLVEMTVNLEKKVKERTAELEESRDQAIAAAKIKSDFLANMSHEIRTPLNGVIGMLSSMQDVQEKKEQEKLIEIALESSRQLLAILNDLLEFSKFESVGVAIDPEDTNLREILEQCVHQFSFMAKQKKLAVYCFVDPHIPDLVEADGFRIKQVITNLLSNAIKFTSQGEIVVKAEIIENGNIRFSVSDTGIGLQSDQLNTIFGAFNQGDSSITRQYGGTGLGLAICTKIIQKMQSEIHVESTAGVGTIFSFDLTLPAKTETTFLSRHKGTIPEIPIVVLSKDQKILDRIAEILNLLGNNTYSCLHNIEDIPHSISSKAEECFVIVDLDDFNQCDAENMLRTCMLKHTIITFGSYSQKDRKGNGTCSIFKPVKLDELLCCLTNSEYTPELATPPSTKSSEFKNKTILVVDDSPINHEVVRHLLMGTNCHLLQAFNGKDALQQVQKNKVDLIFMDVQMPVMDGVSAAREIRKLGSEYATLPIIAMTAQHVVSDAGSHEQSSMNEHIMKPVFQESLLKILHKYLDNIEFMPKVSNSLSQTIDIQFPDLPGFDFTDATKRLNNDPHVLCRLLSTFAKKHVSFNNEITEALRENDYDNVIKLGHALKGTSANLGAKELSRVGEMIENHFKNGNTELPAPLFKKMESEIKNLKLLQQWLSENEYSSSKPGDSAVKETSLFQQLNLLLEYLYTDIAKAQNIIESINEVPKNHEEDTLIKNIQQEFSEFNLDQVKDMAEKYLFSLQNIPLNSASK